jgi:DNA mismatch repair ATPase MutS
LRDIFKLSCDNNRILPRYEPGEQPLTLAAQYNWFARQLPRAIILIQVGRFCELYNQSAAAAAKILKVRISGGGRGFAKQAGFPMGGLHTAKQRLLASGLSYIVVAENGWLRSGLKKRVMTEKFSVIY